MTSIPNKVAQLACGDSIQMVWRNELGGLTFRLRGKYGDRYVKWQSYAGLDTVRKSHVDLRVEAEKLKWAGQFTRVPRVLEHGTENHDAWLVTEAIAGRAAYDLRATNEPETAVRAIATGLRYLHDTLPVTECPYRGAWLGPNTAKVPNPEQLVVCHGDPCVPNTLVDASGNCVGHVDLGQLGVADRWADIAIATYSISWKMNFGRSYDELFFDTYGIQPDYDRIMAYRELWDVDDI